MGLVFGEKGGGLGFDFSVIITLSPFFPFLPGPFIPSPPALIWVGFGCYLAGETGLLLVSACAWEACLFLVFVLSCLISLGSMY